MKKTTNLYEIKFNDFGTCHAVADSFQEVESLFWKEYGGNVPNFSIKSIVLVPSQNILFSPLSPR